MNPKERGIKLLDAIIEGKQDVAFQLIRDGADLTVQRKGDNAIHLAARTGDLDIIKELKAVDLDLPNLHGNTPAHYAATGGFLHLVQFLKSKGVNLNANNDYGNTPLHEAVLQQPMDVLENLIELGMDPNRINPRTGETPAHIAARFGKRIALEALILRGANLNTKDNCNRKPADVAKDDVFRQIVRMYETKAAAFGICPIWAAGMKLTNISALQVREVERVGIILEGIHNLDVPKRSPASFYSRREKPEEASVPLKHFEDEHVFSDIFFILISNASMWCIADILLPLYALPSEKEELVLRFISSGGTDRPVEEIVTIDETHYVSLQTTLTPEVTCICLINSRPKQEEYVVSSEGGQVQVSMEPEFSLDIPPGAFETDTLFTFKVFETQALNVKSKKAGERSWGMKVPSCPLLTSVFDITLSGHQPKKAITVQMPVTGDTYKVNEMVILKTEPNKAVDVNSDLLPMQPKYINKNLIFTMSHFSTYVAVSKERVVTEKDLKIIENHISHARERRRPATFFAAVKHTEGRSFILLVDFGLASKTKTRRNRWKGEGFRLEKPSNESEAFMVLPGDEFFADIKGQARFEDPGDAKEQKFCFSACRISCNQTFKIQLDSEAIDSDTTYGEVVIYKPPGSGDTVGYEKEVCRLRVTLNVSQPEKQQVNDHSLASGQTNSASAVKKSFQPQTSRQSTYISSPLPSSGTPSLLQADSRRQSQQQIPALRRIMSDNVNVRRTKHAIQILTEKNMLTAPTHLPKAKGTIADGRTRLIEPCQGKAYLSAHRKSLPGRSKTSM